jgi:hypothetical protein
MDAMEKKMTTELEKAIQENLRFFLRVNVLR